ncbi:hypothetical protein [Yersinia massiliensis]|uniref:hypothetical protein n=1 Tax=Yersinia massiliensis TaxID=419257 RepID=UPI0011A5DF07|nr:hypothetical protein [Yersinia massiliensis]MCB5308950.1 hypothetical protein [Yersinia massiliensis]
MSSIGTKVYTAITKAFDHTKADHFTKKDMSKLLSLTKEIKNSPISFGPCERLSVEQKNEIGSKIKEMIDSVAARESKLQPKKMNALTGLQAQLVKITSTNQPKAMADTSRLEKQKADKASTENDRKINSQQNNMQSTSNRSHLQFDQQ